MWNAQVCSYLHLECCMRERAVGRVSPSVMRVLLPWSVSESIQRRDRASFCWSLQKKRRKQTSDIVFITMVTIQTKVLSSCQCGTKKMFVCEILTWYSEMYMNHRLHMHNTFSHFPRNLYVIWDKKIYLLHSKVIFSVMTIASTPPAPLYKGPP